MIPAHGGVIIVLPEQQRIALSSIASYTTETDDITRITLNVATRNSTLVMYTRAKPESIDAAILQGLHDYRNLVKAGVLCPVVLSKVTSSGGES